MAKLSDLVPSGKPLGDRDAQALKQRLRVYRQAEHDSGYATGTEVMVQQKLPVSELESFSVAWDEFLRDDCLDDDLHGQVPKWLLSDEFGSFLAKSEAGQPEEKKTPSHIEHVACCDFWESMTGDRSPTKYFIRGFLDAITHAYFQAYRLEDKW